jgi:hypothetical protein
MMSTVIGGAMLPHAPQFFTMPDTEDKAVVSNSFTLRPHPSPSVWEAIGDQVGKLQGAGGMQSRPDAGRQGCRRS